MSEVIIYTDGSCQPNPGVGGYGFIIIDENIQIHDCGGSLESTNNVMELTAVIEALSLIHEEKRPIKIYTDSMYVKNCASGVWKRSKNVDVWKKYDAVAKNKTITFFWVKGHDGDKYNEMVDKLAEKGRLEVTKI